MAINVKLLEILFSCKTEKEMVSSIGCVEIYVHLANVDSLNCVSVKTMRSYDRKLICVGMASQVCSNGAKIWT